MQLSEPLFGVKAAAGGKVMLTGGYLVLERPNNGLVLALDANIHSSIHSLKKASGYKTSLVLPENSFPIYLQTPQLCVEGIEMYATVDRTDNANPKISIGGEAHRNKFVTTTLQYGLAMICAVLTKQYWDELVQDGFAVYIYGDIPFYSSSNIAGTDRSTPSVDSDTNLPLYLPHTFDPNDFKTKTGLGSSAALVSSLTSALFSYFGLFNSEIAAEFNSKLPKTQENPNLPAIAQSGIMTTISDIKAHTLFRMVYQTAQLSHCAAQGKVGSGFDVAACFYGNQTYCRFSPSIISTLLSSSPEVPLSGKGLLDTIGPNSPVWDDASTPFSLPKGLQILLGDVHGGSETPGMIKALMQWRDSSLEGPTKWNEVAMANTAVEEAFFLLTNASVANVQAYDDVLSSYSKMPCSEWTLSASSSDDAVQSIESAFIQLRDALSKARTCLRMMGTLSGVPIEPAPQTLVLDAAMSVPGVIGSGVPGAGGYDAVFVLYFEQSQAAVSVATQWSSDASLSHGLAVTPLNVTISKEPGISIHPILRQFFFPLPTKC